MWGGETSLRTNGHMHEAHEIHEAQKAHEAQSSSSQPIQQASAAIDAIDAATRMLAPAAPAAAAPAVAAPAVVWTTIAAEQESKYQASQHAQQAQQAQQHNTHQTQRLSQHAQQVRLMMDGQRWANNEHTDSFVSLFLFFKLARHPPHPPHPPPSISRTLSTPPPFGTPVYSNNALPLPSIYLSDQCTSFESTGVRSGRCPSRAVESNGHVQRRRYVRCHQGGGLRSRSGTPGRPTTRQPNQLGRFPQQQDHQFVVSSAIFGTKGIGTSQRKIQNHQRNVLWWGGQKMK